jgi:hypothetical protein
VRRQSLSAGMFATGDLFAREIRTDKPSKRNAFVIIIVRIK